MEATSLLGQFPFMHPQISQVAGNAPYFSPLSGALRPFQGTVITNFTLRPPLIGSHLTHLGMHVPINEKIK
jgi:hypothetical protein